MVSGFNEGMETALLDDHQLCRIWPEIAGYASWNCLQTCIATIIAEQPPDSWVSNFLRVLRRETQRCALFATETEVFDIAGH